MFHEILDTKDQGEYAMHNNRAEGLRLVTEFRNNTTGFIFVSDDLEPWLIRLAPPPPPLPAPSLTPPAAASTAVSVLCVPQFSLGLHIVHLDCCLQPFSKFMSAMIQLFPGGPNESLRQHDKRSDGLKIIKEYEESNSPTASSTAILDNWKRCLQEQPSATVTIDDVRFIFNSFDNTVPDIGFFISCS